MQTDSLLPRFLKQLAPSRWPPFFILGGSKREEAVRGINELLHKALCMSLESQDNCSSCKDISKRQHNELIWIESESSRIKVKELEGLAEHLSTAPMRPGSKRCAVIMDFENLSASAAAYLLKTLEELPPHSQVIAYATAPLKILATLRSRGPLYRLVRQEAIERVYDGSLHEATRLLLKGPAEICRVSETWTQLARSKACSLEDFFSLLEFELNREYKLHLQNKSVAGGLVTQGRRQVITELRSLALSKGISLNLRACAEQVSLLSGG